MSDEFNILDTNDTEFKNVYPDLIKKIEYKKLYEYEPTIHEIREVQKVILDYIKKHNRKIYGGYALNKLLINKDPSLAIYDDLDTPDVEFYSPKPLEDLVAICDILHEKGYKQIIGQEAKHKETYSIFVNYHLYCDISYIPANINGKARFIDIDGLKYIHPYFMMIDYFRMFTDPMTSYWRLDKHFNRFLKLQKTYPLPKTGKDLLIKSHKSKGINNIMNKLENYLSEQDTLVFTGFYSYNYYLYENNNKNYVYIPYYEVFSSEYVKDGLDIVKFIESLNEDKITKKEFYPFFQFYGYNTVFYYDEIPILYLYSNNKKCLQYKTVDYIEFQNNNENSCKAIKKKTKINLASFDFNILHVLIMLAKVRVDDKNDMNDTLYKLLNGFVKQRTTYLEKNKKTIYDDTIFGSFVIDCKGETIDPERENRLKYRVRKSLKKPLVFRYEPGVSTKVPKYNFMNSSGNAINNERNLKLKEENVDLSHEDELLNEEKSNVSDDEFIVNKTLEK